MIELGAIVKDTITGAKGFVIGRAEYLFDTASVYIQPYALDEKGIPSQCYWISEGRMEEVNASK